MFIQTVALKEVKFYAFHGFYPEEQLTGNQFSVDVEVTFMPKGDSEDLGETVNYEVINSIIRTEMQNTQKLLETVVSNIINQLLLTYPFLLSAKTGIKKFHPVMPGQVGYSFVALSYTA